MKQGTRAVATLDAADRPANAEIDNRAYPDAVLAAELPKVTDWMQAWGSLLGVAVSTLAVIITGVLLRHEMRARRDDKEDTDAAQARLIATDITDFSSGVEATSVTLTVTNHSGAPIYEAYVSMRDSRSRNPRRFAGARTAYSKYIAPGTTTTEEFVLTRSMSAGDLDFAEVVIRFIDAGGLWWSKAGTGVPVRLRAVRRPRGVGFWRALWYYLWPISTPVRSVPRGLRRARSQARWWLHLLTLRMHRQVLIRASRAASRARNTERN